MSESSKTSCPMEKEANFRCVRCCFPIRTLYIQYSPGNIRLKKCESCGKVADEYIECELMIVVIDLILHKAEAYRHLFYNMHTRSAFDFEGYIWGPMLGLLWLDSYGTWCANSSIMESSSQTDSLSWAYVKILIGSLLGNVLFMSVILIGYTKFLSASEMKLRNKQILLGILVSSYFKISLLATMVWDFPFSMILLIDMFVLSSNTVALKVLSDSTTAQCLSICLAAHTAKFLVNGAFMMLS